MTGETGSKPASGYPMLFLGLVLLALTISSLVMGIRTENAVWVAGIIVGVGGFLLAQFLLIRLEQPRIAHSRDT